VPSGAVALARAELAAELLADLRHIDAQLRRTSKKLAAAARASGTSLTQLFGAGPGTLMGNLSGDAMTRSQAPDFEARRCSSYARPATSASS
jgi:hypothetical protein